MITKESNFLSPYKFQHHVDRLDKRGLSLIYSIAMSDTSLRDPHQLYLFQQCFHFSFCFVHKIVWNSSWFLIVSSIMILTLRVLLLPILPLKISLFYRVIDAISGLMPPTWNFSGVVPILFTMNSLLYFTKLSFFDLIESSG